MTVNHSGQFERVGRLYKAAADACDAVQVDPSRLPRGNGRANVLGAHGKGDASIRLHADNRGGCVFNHKTRQCAVWREDAGQRMSREERRRRKREEVIRRAEEEERERRRFIFGSETARIILRAAAPIQSHEYLKKKHVRPICQMYGIDSEAVNDVLRERGYRNESGEFSRCFLAGFLLVIPIYRDSVIQSLELIGADGRKYFLKDAVKSGGYWMTRNPSAYLDASVIGIGEGVATVMSVDLVKGFPCVAAMDCGNLIRVAKRIRGINPRARLVILSDVGNGEQQAVDAANACHGVVALPRFTDALRTRFKTVTGGDKPTDWNDYFIATGELR